MVMQLYKMFIKYFLILDVCSDCLDKHPQNKSWLLINYNTGLQAESQQVLNGNMINTVAEIRARNWSAIFLRIGHFIAYWLLSHWKCIVKLANQNGFWSAKCWNWLENGQWPTVISSAVKWDYICYLWFSRTFLWNIHKMLSWNDV